MKVYLFGFEWAIKGDRATQVTLADLFAYLKSIHGKEIDFKGANRLIYVNETDTYYTGLLLTAKDYKRFCELDKTGPLKINVREASDGTSLIDFNFFVVNKATGRGLYQHYRGSCWVNAFGDFCSEQLDDLCDERIAADIKAKGGIDALKDKELRQARRKYDGQLEFMLLVKEETFNQILSNMTKITSFQFAFATIRPEQESLFRPLKGVAQIVRERISFIRGSALHERKKALLEFLGANKVEEAAVHGICDDGLERTILLASNPDSFGSYDFDEIAGDMNIQPDAFHDSNFMKKLLMVAATNPRFLGAPAK